MISIYTGTVGSGKSYHALEVLLSKVWGKFDRYAIANFPINYSKKGSKRYIKETERFRFWEDITPEKLIAYSIEKAFYGKEGYCTLIIDEAGIMFNSRDWQVESKKRKNWVNFLSLSRKFGYDIILITQVDRLLDRQIRTLAEYEVRHFKMTNHWYLKWLPFKLHASSMFWYNTKFNGKVELFTIKSYIAKKYDTMRIFNFNELKSAILSLYKGSVIPATIVIFLEQLKAKYAVEKDSNVKDPNDLVDFLDKNKGSFPVPDNINLDKKDN